MLMIVFLPSAVITNPHPNSHTQPKNVRPNKPRRHAIHQTHRKIRNFNQTGSDADLRIISTRSASSPHQRSPSDTDTFGPRSVIGPIYQRITANPICNTNGTDHHTGRNTNDRPICGSTGDSSHSANSLQIPPIGNNSPLGDGDTCRSRHLCGVRLPRDQSIIGLNGFLVVLSRSFRLIFGLKLRHLRLLRTLRNRMRCSHSLTRRTKEHSDRHNKSHHRSTNPPQHSSHTHRDLSFEVIESRQDIEYSHLITHHNIPIG